MANTNKAVVAPRFRVYVTVDTGQIYEMEQPRTAAEAQAYASSIVVAGWWNGPNWYPPHRLRGIRTEPWGQS